MPVDKNEIHITPAEPSRSDVLIDETKKQKTQGRFTLRGLFLMTLMVAAGLAAIRGLGLLKFVTSIWFAAVVCTYLFAPTICFSLILWLTNRQSFRTTFLASLLPALIVFCVVILQENVTGEDLAGLALIGAIFWTVEFAVLLVLGRGVFGKSTVRRELPEEY